VPWAESQPCSCRQQQQWHKQQQQQQQHTTFASRLANSCLQEGYCFKSPAWAAADFVPVTLKEPFRQVCCGPACGLWGGHLALPVLLLLLGLPAVPVLMHSFASARNICVLLFNILAFIKCPDTGLLSTDIFAAAAAAAEDS